MSKVEHGSEKIANFARNAGVERGRVETTGFEPVVFFKFLFIIKC